MKSARLSKALIGLTIIAGPLAGLATAIAMKKPVHPISLFGSGNVHAFLDVRGTLEDFEPLWVDTASGSALDQIFVAFSYGRSTQATNRGGALALSSNGNKHLVDVVNGFKGNPEDSRIQSNYFLTIDIARRPLILLYRQVDKLRVAPASTERDYPSVDAKDVLALFSGPPPERVRRYVPEAGSGTREVFQPIISKLKADFVWPDGEPTGSRNLDDLGGQDSEPFFMVISEVPPTKDKLKTDDQLCRALKDRNLGVAAILLDQKMLYATFTVVMKLVNDGTDFRIQDPAECAVANAFIGPELAGRCQMKDGRGKEFHIIQRPPSGALVPEALQPQLRCNTL
jgi:hypothetical protein